MKRVISCIATAMLALAMTAAVAPADAATHHRTKALPTREITLKYQDAGVPMVKLSGKADKYAGHKVLIQRQYGQDWRTIKKAECNKRFRYVAKIKVPATGKHYSFRVKTPKTKKFANSYSQIVELYWT